MIRVRFAPSPTGNLHIGTVRTALFNFLFAKNQGGVCVMRIEDTDLERSEAIYEDNIYDGLDWLGLKMDEGPREGGAYGPYRQSERITAGFYKEKASALVESGHAYPCFCTQDDIDAERRSAEEAKRPHVYSQRCRNLSAEARQAKFDADVPYAIRFAMPDGKMTFEDLIRGTVTFDQSLIGDFIILKSDQSPSYNFAVVVDDADMAITHVVRGEDHISNTPRQIAIARALNIAAPVYAHMPMILGHDRAKLSKRHGATAVTEYQKQGFLDAAMFNFLTLMGWSSPEGEEILSRDEIIAQFSLDRLSKSAAIFDGKKLTWLNGQYIRKLPPEDYLTRVRKRIGESTLATLEARFDAATQVEILMMCKDNLDLMTDIDDRLTVFTLGTEAFKQNIRDMKIDKKAKGVMQRFKDRITGNGDKLDATGMAQILDDIVEETGSGKGRVWRPIRQACTGFGSGPDIAMLLAILGPETCSQRIDYVLSAK